MSVLFGQYVHGAANTSHGVADTSHGVANMLRGAANISRSAADTATYTAFTSFLAKVFSTFLGAKTKKTSAVLGFSGFTFRIILGKKPF